jgi:NAD(P)-dependent dehydrogenase (short-subunit alcohol dehydrogenase family)
MEEQLRGRWAVVTGGAGGIGRAMAIALHDRGMHVVVGDINPPLEAAPLPAAVKFVRTDVTEPDALERLADAVEDDAPALWVSNAGIAVEVGDQLILKSPNAKRWRDVVAINLQAVIEGSQIALHRMLAARRNGSTRPFFVVSTSSASGLTPREAAVYSSCKAGVNHFTRSIALTLKKRKVEGIKVFAVCPTFTETPMMRSLSGKGLISRSKEQGIIAPASAISEGMLHLIDQEAENGSVMRFDTADHATVASIVQYPLSPALPVLTSRM